MPKSRTHFVCRVCGSVHPKWLGKCPDCGTWDALERMTELAAPRGSEAEAAKWLPAADSDAHGGEGGEHGAPATANEPEPLDAISVADVPRLRTGVAEFDRALGGGLVPGSVVLLGGDPGIGKSTLLLQALAGLAGATGEGAASARPILYVSSEESARQVRLRADRLLAEPDEHGAIAPPLDRLLVLAETNLARIGEHIRRLRPALCAIDSIQMIHRPDLDAAPGSVAQIRRCCTDLVYLAKRSGMPVIVVGHVTKDGSIAGPKLLEHLVDVVLSFEGDRHHAHRIVRALKNRFGSTQEIGLFEMTGRGMREATAAGARGDLEGPPPVGTAICPAILGTRCLLAEIEALTATGVLGNARRKASGVDANRLAMLIAVLEKHGGLRLADQDVFVSAAGGLRAVEPGADLALALAIAGVHYGRAAPAGSAAFGEIGLTGRLRGVPHLELRVREAVRRGVRLLLVPEPVKKDATAIAVAAGGRPGTAGHGVSVMGIECIGEAIELLEPQRQRRLAGREPSRPPLASHGKAHPSTSTPQLTPNP